MPIKRRVSKKPPAKPSAKRRKHIEDILESGGKVKVRDKDGNLQTVVIPGFG